MKIIKIKNIVTLIAAVQAFAGVSLHAEDSIEKKDIFEQVFGQKNKTDTLIKIDVTLGEFSIGEIDVVMQGNTLKTVSGEQLNLLIKDKIRTEKKQDYQIPDGQIEKEKLPFEIIYHPSTLRISLEIINSDLKAMSANVYDDLVPYYSKEAKLPGEFSFGLNYKLEQSFNKNNNQEDAFFVQTDLFFNLKDVTIENQMNYLSVRDKGWSRQRTTAVYDRPNSMQRLEAGDVQFPIVGYLESRPMGGVALYKDFSLNPYRQVHATSSYEYQVDSRSLVKTYINNIFLKAEYMAAGRYAVKDIPLNNGVNIIKVEIIDEFGVEKVFIFNESASVDLLHEGVNRYSFALGYKSYDENGVLKYKTEDDLFLSTFYQFGQTRNWTLSGYAHGDKSAQLLGTNHLFSTQYGNYSFDVASNKNKHHAGVVSQLTYQLNLFGAYWYNSHALTSKIEYRSPFFNESGVDYRNNFDFTGTVSYSVPILEKFNLSVGGDYQNPTHAPAARYSYNTGLTAQLVESSSLTLHIGRNRDEFKDWSNQIYAFFNMSFGKSSSFVSTYYENETDTKRLTVIHDTGKKLNDLKVVGQVDDNKNNTNGSLDLQYNSLFADLGARQEIRKTAGNKEAYKTSVRLLSSIAFVKQDGDFGFSVGRPINNSFVIFKPSEGWEGQKVGVHSSFSSSTDSSSGLFGETLISGLTPYQYKRLQLDTSSLDPGFALGQESFVIYPRKNSGHLFVIGKKGLLALRGRILNSQKEAIALKVGIFTSADGVSLPFFTDRDGAFFIEAVESKKGTIRFADNKLSDFELDLSNHKSGVVELGELVILKSEND